MLAKELHLSPEDVIIASTGVIGQPLPLEPIEKGIRDLAPLLCPEGDHAAAEAILTTDLVAKECAVQVEIDGDVYK